MINSLKDYFDEIEAYVQTFEDKLPYFRGVNDGTYDLRPSLFRDRKKLVNKKYVTTTLENNLYYDFTSYGDAIIDLKNEWDILFKMQHHGFPTRLLDWTESLGVALYFALNFSSETYKPCIWVLDPYGLNDIELQRKQLYTDRSYRTLYNPNVDFKDTYYNYFIVNYKKNEDILFKSPLALYPIKSNPRVRAQWGVFTIHGTNEQCLSEQVPKSVLKKFPIPKSVINEARVFLKNSSINHFSMMPDLEGLQRYIKEYYYKK